MADGTQRALDEQDKLDRTLVWSIFVSVGIALVQTPLLGFSISLELALVLTLIAAVVFAALSANTLTRQLVYSGPFVLAMVAPMALNRWVMQSGSTQVGILFLLSVLGLVPGVALLVGVRALLNWRLRRRQGR